MFGFVMANTQELTKPQLDRYNRIYCGVCRQIRLTAGPAARFGLSYDCAFLAMLLMSLYEPEETSGDRACAFHPVKPRPWVDSEYVRYAGQMNILLSYYKALDDCADEDSCHARAALDIFGEDLAEIQARYPRQSQAVADCIQRLSRLEKENCQNPDEPASCFGILMGELLVFREDHWAHTLREMGMGLGRYIYLADAAVDFSKDLRKKQYNPFLAMGCAKPDWPNWEQYLVLAMGKCTRHFETLPLVQDKDILDNILYSGVWLQCRRRRKEQKDGGSQ